MKTASGRKPRSRPQEARERQARPLASPSVIPILIAYGDIPSARQALARLTRRLKASGCDLQPMLWRFDQLVVPRWREMALRDARRARAVTLAVGDEEALALAPQGWLYALLEQKRGASLTILALVGTDDEWTLTLEQSARVAATRRTNRNRRSATSRRVRLREPAAAMGAA